MKPWTQLDAAPIPGGSTLKLMRRGENEFSITLGHNELMNSRLKGSEEALATLAIMKKAGLTMAYGSDLLGEMHKYQSEEFVIRGRALPAHEVIASATHIAAKLLKMEGLIGTVAAGAHADLIVVDGDPLQDLSLLGGQGEHLLAIVKGGAFVKNALAH